MRPTRAHPGEDEQAEENHVTSSLAGLVVALLIVVAGLFLLIQLRGKARTEDLPAVRPHRLRCPGGAPAATTAGSRRC